MQLTHFQKNYIKKNVRKKLILQISEDLDIPKDQVLEYLERRWGKEKFKGFIKKQEQEMKSLRKAATLVQNITHQNKQTKNNLLENPKVSKSWFKENWLNLLILTVLVFITYTNSLNNAFVSDDIAEIRDNPNIGNIAQILTRPFGFIRLLLNWLTFHLAGLNPTAFRLLNIGFHLGGVYLLYRILTIIHSKRLAFFAAAIFAIHPAISEAVVWISGGTYPQYTFFFLLSFLFYILSKESKKFYWASVVVFSFTFQSHPVMPLALFLIFPFFEFCYGNLKRSYFKVIPFFILSIVYVFINLGALPERTTTLHSVHYQERGIDNPILQIPIAITSYLELIFWPEILTLYHSELAFSNFQFFLRALIFLVLLIGTVISLFRNRAIFFWLSLFFISLAPTLTPFRFNWIVAERYIYLSSIGFFVTVSYFLDKLAVKKYQFMIFPIFVAMIISLSARTIIRNIDWHSEDNLWIATGKTSPSSPNTHNNLGDVYGRWGDKQKSIQEFQKAIQLKPNYADAYHNLANVYLELGDQDKAIENYQKAIEFNPILWQSHQNIAAVYFAQKKYDLAKKNIEKAIAINPKNLTLKSNLGLIYLSEGDKNKAKEIFNQVLSIDPQNQIAKQALIEANK